jgi:autotransporter-associated beta strand protein
LQGPIELGSHTLRFDTEGDAVLAGVVSGNGDLVKDNSSALTMGGQNTYTGTTTSNRGALYINSAAAFGDTAAGTTFNGGFLGFSGATFATPEGFVFNGGGIIAYGMPTMTGAVTLNATIGVQAFEAPTRLIISGSIGGSGGLDKRGPGLLILNAPSSSYTGATAVDDGILQLDTALSSASPVTVGNGATLRGNGSCGGAISVQGGGILAPGASPGELSSAGLTMVGGATLVAEINGPTPATEYDRITVNGPISLGGATLTVALGYAPSDGQKFAVISQPQGQGVDGAFAGLAEGAHLQVGAATLGITYQGGGGGDVVLVAGPTPGPTGPTVSAPTDTPTALSTATPTEAPPTSGSPSRTPTPTATPVRPRCTGDCDGNGSVAVNELVVGVNIALETAVLELCSAFDADDDERVTVPELIKAVGNALNGCPPSGGSGFEADGDR